MSIDELFSNKRIVRYPRSLHPEAITHSFEPEREGVDGAIDTSKAAALGDELITVGAAWYEQNFDEQFDKFNIPEGRAQAVLDFYWNHDLFREVFAELQLDWEQHHELINLPWWANEQTLGETNHGYDILNDTLHLTLGPGHSYETQLSRAGIPSPIQKVSVGGIVVAPDEMLVDSYRIITLRAGRSYPNTHHIVAGSLSMSDNFPVGDGSITDQFIDSELTPETGIKREEISSISLVARYEDRLVANEIVYLFSIAPTISADTIRSRFTLNPPEDAGENHELTFVNSAGVRDFIKDNYKGNVRNDPDRSPFDRALLYPGLVALVAFDRLNLEDYKDFHVEK